MRTIDPQIFSHDQAIGEVKQILKQLKAHKVEQAKAVELIRTANMLMKSCLRDLRELEVELHERVDDVL